MSALSDLLRRWSDVDAGATQHLQQLVAQWQLLSDLSFADLLLWVRTGSDFVCVAQCRPTTGPTAYLSDQVGQRLGGAPAAALQTALAERRIFRESDADWAHDVPVRHEAIPVVYAGEVIAVLGRDANLHAVRGPSQLELTYLQSAADLAAMVSDGTFPPPLAATDDGVIPRAGDGLLRLDTATRVLYASPNALSALRRMGVAVDVVGTVFGDLIGGAVGDGLDAAELVSSVERAAAGAFSGSHEVQGTSAIVQFRPLPLTPRGERLGALVLLQDVTEVRRRDRQIITKEATIREIHHRVKNNLQTVAALLRLQARRVAAPQARTALEEAMRRVSAIALVHETLSTAGDDSVDFDAVLDRLLGMLDDVTGADGRLSLRRVGSFGSIPAGLATSLVMVLAELVQNAVEHGFGEDGRGSVEVRAERTRGGLAVSVVDDGRGLPAGFDPNRSDRLGLQIVRTLASADLHTDVRWSDRENHSGVVARLAIDVDRFAAP